MKRGLIIGLALVLFSGLLGGCGKDWSHIQAEDFVLTITSDKTTYGRHEDIIINISLENKSGEDLEIAYYFLFNVRIPTSSISPSTPEIPQYPNIKVFKAGEVIQERENLAGLFEPLGEHEIYYSAFFYLGGRESEEMRRDVYSNTIKITVIE